MAFGICSFSSGSRGNCSLVTNGSTNVLVDAGISFSRLKRCLASLDLSVDDLDGVVITHEHTDHVCGLETLSQYVPVYAHERTAAAIEKRSGKSLQNLALVKNYDLGFEVGDVSVVPFRLPHDAAYPLGYSFYYNGKKICVATDIGHITDGIVKNLSGSNVVLLEANHDVEMLKHGKYAEVLKRRILSDTGHLSNDSASEAVCRVLSDKLERIVLGHLSQENNLATLAYKTVADGMKSKGAIADKDIMLEVATQSTATELFLIGRS